MMSPTRGESCTGPQQPGRRFVHSLVGPELQRDNQRQPGLRSGDATSTRLMETRGAGARQALARALLSNVHVDAVCPNEAMLDALHDRGLVVRISRKINCKVELRA